MNSEANRFRLMGHKVDESSLEAVKKEFTYTNGELEDTLGLHLIGLKKEAASS